MDYERILRKKKKKNLKNPKRLITEFWEALDLGRSTIGIVRNQVNNYKTNKQKKPQRIFLKYQQKEQDNWMFGEMDGETFICRIVTGEPRCR